MLKYLFQESSHKKWTDIFLDPEIVKMESFLDPEIVKKERFLDPEIVKMVDRSFMKSAGGVLA